jgi:sulfite exporter TauE/SafE
LDFGRLGRFYHLGGGLPYFRPTNRLLKAGWETLSLKFWPIVALALLLIIIIVYQPDGLAQYQPAFAAIQLIDPHNTCTIDPSAATTSSFFVLLSAGLLTGFSHCAGMCGPLVGAFAARRRAARQELSTPLALFQSGRLTTYVLLGALVGGLGQTFGTITQTWQIFFSMTLGLLIMLVGLGLWGLLPMQRWIVSIKWAYFVSRWIKGLIAWPHPAAPFGLGLANGLLPCGAIYAVSLVAAMAGDPVKGAGVMFIFGLGTLPAMVGIGFSASRLSLHFRSQLHRVATALVMIIGLQLTLRGLALSGQISHVTIGGLMLW